MEDAKGPTRPQVLDIKTRPSSRASVTMLLPQSLWAAVEDRAAKECTTVPKLVERVLSKYVATDGWLLRAAANSGRGLNLTMKKADPPDPPDGDAA